MLALQNRHNQGHHLVEDDWQSNQGGSDKREAQVRQERFRGGKINHSHLQPLSRQHQQVPDFFNKGKADNGRYKYRHRNDD